MRGMLIDVTRCTGCQTCVKACSESHGLEPEIAARKQSCDGLSGRRLSSVQGLDGAFVKKQCLHCLEPGCVDACLVGALTRDEDGAVVYDETKCIGCRYCMLACPMDVPRYEWDKKLPLVKKCDFCFERVADGKLPACADACPNGVIVTGERQALIDEAKARIKQSPDRYLDHVYGEHELGGTAVVYIADAPLDAMGWPKQVGERAMHDYTWPVMSKTPWLALGVGGFLVGVNTVIRRRMKLQAEAIAAQASDVDEDQASPDDGGDK